MINLSGQCIAYELEVIKEKIVIIASKNKKELKNSLEESIRHLDLIIRLLDDDITGMEHNCNCEQNCTCDNYED